MGKGALSVELVALRTKTAKDGQSGISESLDMLIVVNEWVPFTVLQCFSEYHFINADQQSCSFFLNGCHGNNHMTGSKLRLNSYLCSLWLLVQVDSGYRDKVMQHQAYQPVLPSVNKYLQYRWDKSCYEMHRKKVKGRTGELWTYH